MKGSIVSTITKAIERYLISFDTRNGAAMHYQYPWDCTFGARFQTILTHLRNPKYVLLWIFPLITNVVAERKNSQNHIGANYIRGKVVGNLSVEGGVLGGADFAGRRHPSSALLVFCHLLATENHAHLAIICMYFKSLSLTLERAFLKGAETEQ